MYMYECVNVHGKGGALSTQPHMVDKSDSSAHLSDSSDKWVKICCPRIVKQRV